MEENTGFDLNRQIEQWRSALLEAEGFRRENVEELELHLRDSVAQLETQGLSSEEAFLIAVRRMGGQRELASEFTKVNQTHVWRSRLLWMLGGFWVFRLITLLVAIPSRFAGLWSAKFAVSSTLIGVICWTMNLIGLVAVCYVGWVLLTRREKLWSQILRFCYAYPIRACAGLVVLTLTANGFYGLFELWRNAYMRTMAVDVGRYLMAFSVEGALTVLVQNLAIPLLLVYLLRRQKGEGCRVGFGT